MFNLRQIVHLILEKLLKHQALFFYFKKEIVHLPLGKALKVPGPVIMEK